LGLTKEKPSPRSEKTKENTETKPPQCALKMWYNLNGTNKNETKGRRKKMNNQFNVVGIDPTRFLADGYGFWRDENERIFKDNVLVTFSKEDAYWASVACGQICYLHVSYEGAFNGYLLEIDEAQLAELFNKEKVTGYTVITNPSKLEGIPQCFTVLSPEEAKQLGLVEGLRPVFYEFVYVRR
jgi:hypothetical protein